MRILLLNICTLIILSLFSCEKDLPFHEDPPATQAKLHVVWQKHVYDDKAGAFFCNPHFSGAYVGFCSRSPYDKNDGKLGAVLFDKRTGISHPAWNHEPNFNYSLLCFSFELILEL